MGASRLRFFGQWLAGPVTALSLIADASGVELKGHTIEWQYLALLGFLVFVLLATWQQWAMHREIHDAEFKISLNFRPDPVHAGSSDWFNLYSLSDHANYYGVF